MTRRTLLGCLAGAATAPALAAIAPAAVKPCQVKVGDTIAIRRAPRFVPWDGKTFPPAEYDLRIITGVWPTNGPTMFTHEPAVAKF
jgi:hypothetical protein